MRNAVALEPERPRADATMRRIGPVPRRVRSPPTGGSYFYGVYHYYAIFFMGVIEVTQLYLSRPHVTCV